MKIYSADKTLKQNSPLTKFYPVAQFEGICLASTPNDFTNLLHCFIQQYCDLDIVGWLFSDPIPGNLDSDPCSAR